jgi:hypothetical protein
LRVLALSNGARQLQASPRSSAGTVGYKVALAGDGHRAAGSLAAIVLAEALLSGSRAGLVPTPWPLRAVSGRDRRRRRPHGAGRLRLGLPISTHAIAGAMADSGWMAVGSAVQLGALNRTVASNSAVAHLA